MFMGIYIKMQLDGYLTKLLHYVQVMSIYIQVVQRKNGWVNFPNMMLDGYIIIKVIIMVIYIELIGRI